MVSWLRGTTWFQRIALILLLAALAAWAFLPAASAWMFPALLIAFLAFRRRLLWGVRNRLLVTYFLFGVVPLFLISWMLVFSSILLLNQVAGARVRTALEDRMESIHILSQDLMLAASASSRTELLENMRLREPRSAAVALLNGSATWSAQTDPGLREPPKWMNPGFRGLFEHNGVYYLGVYSSDARQNAAAFAYIAMDDATRASLAPGAIAVEPPLDADASTNMGVDFTVGSRLAVIDHGVRKEIQPANAPAATHSWDLMVATVVSEPVLTASGKTRVAFPVFSRPSLLLSGIVTGPEAGVIVFFMKGVVGVLLLIELGALIWTVLLTRTITASVHNLHAGTSRVASGDFSHSVPVRGRHQLGELAASFNGMMQKIQHYIGEMRKKEKLESELEIARQVQARLFPRTVPELKTLEMAGVCLPGRFVSGDYYDFVRLNERFTAIALGDVSGKGVSAALLMASIQSSLHSQLKFSGSALNPSLSTATLMALISRQLYESTPAEKYATFFCSVYDDETGMLRYTNCGHLKPILVRGGVISSLDGDGMVVGLFPESTYEQREFQLESGDLVALFSDGIPEAEDAGEEQFGEDRLSQVLAEHADEPLDKIIENVLEGVRAWTYDPDGRDDTTIVLVRKRQRPA